MKHPDIYAGDNGLAIILTLVRPVIFLKHQISMKILTSLFFKITMAKM